MQPGVDPIGVAPVAGGPSPNGLHPFVAAKTLCELRGWNVTNLEVQKVLYLAHMAFLGRNGGRRRLIAEPFEAWDYGPVIPSLYHRLKVFGAGSVGNVFHGIPIVTQGDEAAVIREASEKLANKSPGELIANTHREGGAWADHYCPGARGLVIPDNSILEEYRKRVGQ